MILLAHLNIVLHDRVLHDGCLVIEKGRIAEVREGSRVPAGSPRRDLHGHWAVPGFIDVHVHGVEGYDTVGSSAPLSDMAARLTCYGVTAFCPTTIACSPEDLERVLRGVRDARVPQDEAARARVLPAHLESNFIHPDYRGAQPLEYLCAPPIADAPRGGADRGREILHVIETYRSEVGIATIAPELPHALALIRRLTAQGIRVSLGHSAATLDEAYAGIDAGAGQATHLFNRMPPLHHREPGLAGAILGREDVAAEIVCDGYHVHPVMVRAAIGAKHVSRVMAITDGTAGSGLPVGSRVDLGGRPIGVRETACFLDDGTLAGSRLTMDGAFRFLVEMLGFSVVDAARLCATTQAAELGLADIGVIRPGAVADLALLGPDWRVRSTYVGGRLAYDASAAEL